MSGRCVELREMSPGGGEMPTSGGEREKRRAWTHDITPPLKERLSDVPERPTRGTHWEPRVPGWGRQSRRPGQDR